MRTVEAEGERAGEPRGAGGMVPNIHNARYHIIYCMSNSI